MIQRESQAITGTVNKLHQGAHTHLPRGRVYEIRLSCDPHFILSWVSDEDMQKLPLFSDRLEIMSPLPVAIIWRGRT